MRHIYVLLTIGMVGCFIACSQQHRHRETISEFEEVSAYDMVSEETISQKSVNESDVQYVSSSAAIGNPNDSTRKFVRRAELKFRVQNVIQSTYDIEEIVKQEEGFITYTKLTSDIDYTKTNAVSKDSSLFSTYFTVKNVFELRVPNAHLDTVLKQIARTIDFLDYRVIKADDVSLQMLSNRLTEERLSKNEKRLTDAIDNRGRRLNETTSAEELLLNKQEQADRAKLSNLMLADQISYSTIQLHIYQNQSVKQELIANEKNIDVYKPGFQTRIWEAVLSGWNILAETIIFLTNLWGLFVFAIIIYLIFRMIRNWRARRMEEDGEE